MTQRTPTHFWSRVDQGHNPDDCWIWKGSVGTNGYGSLSIGRRKFVAHRFAYELLIGPIPAGLVVDHMCHNADLDCAGGPCLHRSCVNPSHLRAITSKENTLASKNPVTSQHAAKSHCPSGHEYSETNTLIITGHRYCRTCRATWERARNARRRARYQELRASGLSVAEAQAGSKRLAS